MPASGSCQLNQSQRIDSPVNDGNQKKPPSWPWSFLIFQFHCVFWRVHLYDPSRRPALFVSYWSFFLFFFDRIWSVQLIINETSSESKLKMTLEEPVCICLQPPLVNSSTPVTWWPLFGPCPSIYPEAHPSLQRSTQNCTSSAKCCRLAGF